MVTPREANLLPTYATLGAPTTATVPAVELMLTIAPPPTFFMKGITVFIPQIRRAAAAASAGCVSQKSAHPCSGPSWSVL
ncbi:hypothetical protein GCM10027562_20950 [Arthrobacter pigmenti]